MSINDCGDIIALADFAETFGCLPAVSGSLSTNLYEKPQIAKFKGVAQCNDLLNAA